MDRRSLFKGLMVLPALIAGSALSEPLPYLDKNNRDLINSSMRQAIENALKVGLFEVNDEETRSKVAAIVDSFALHLKETNVIAEYEIVCDETNNPPEYVESNRLEVYATLRDANSDLVYMIIGTAGPAGIDVKTIEFWNRD